jgi:SPP1 gp7 family putative phage head morphogenesis protein
MPKGAPLERIARSVLLSTGQWQLRFIEQVERIRKDQIDPLDPLLGSQRMAASFIPYIDATIDLGGRTVLAELGQAASDDWLIRNPQAIQAARVATLALCEETVTTFLTDMNATLNGMRQGVAESIATGETLGDTVERMAKWVNTESRWRARRIAVTESARAYNTGAMAATDDLDFVAGYKWLLSDDACPLCHNVARLCPVIPKGGTFAVNGKNPAYRNVRVPPLHPNCRCSLTTVFDDEVPPEWPKTVAPPPGENYIQPDDTDIAAAEEGGYEAVSIGNAKTLGGFVIPWGNEGVDHERFSGGDHSDDGKAVVTQGG